MKPCYRVTFFSLFCLVALILALASAQTTRAAGTYTVNRTDDIAPRGIAATCNAPGSVDCTLREAVIKANANPGSTIVFAGSLNGTPIILTIPGDDDAAAQGDLDVTASVTITGNGPANTIIQAGTNNTNGIDKVFGLNPTCDRLVNVTMSGITIRYGRNATLHDLRFQDTGGGMDWCGYGAGAFNLSDCVISDNTAVTSYGGGLNIDSVTGNTGPINITNTIFRNNKTLSTTYPSNGGGINLWGEHSTSNPINISSSTFVDNTTAAGSAGGGINVRLTNASTVNVNYSRFVNNTAGTGNGLSHEASSQGAVNAENNWWGCNAGPGNVGCDSVSAFVPVTDNPRLVLSHTASPSSINTTQSTILTGSFLQNSAGGTISSGNLSALVGLPITFNNPVLGTLSGAQAAIQSNGTATATFTAGSSTGVGHADATVDNQTVTANITINSTPNLSINDVSLNEGNSGTTTFSFTVSLSTPAGAGGVTFDIATADDTATAPGDYIAKSLTGQSIPAGNSTYTFNVLVNGDTIYESNETLHVNVSNVVGANVSDSQGFGTISNDDGAPEMDLKQGATPIADGGSHDFGSPLVGSNSDVVFTIENSGTGDLTLTTPISIGGANADQFNIQVQPASPVAAAGSTIFTVRFSPTSPGAKTATISIANNDSDENPYDLIINGTGTLPEMDLKQGVTVIANGGSYDFGSQALNSSTNVVFTIENSGTGNLTLTTPISIGGANADQFSIQAQPASPVAGSGSTTFMVRFTPTSVGAKTAIISIANNDSDENPYDLTITGIGTATQGNVGQSGGSGGGGCFIAATDHGSYLRFSVETLKSFIDKFLPINRLRKSFITWYHRVSP